MKNSYILLRNNVESSSLHLEDLEQIGILPTDLIWVECQSVCWQKPIEIAELKNLVTKNSDQHTNNNPTESTEDPIETFESTANENSKKKLVFVELPAKAKPIEKKKIAEVNNDAVLVSMNKYANPEKKTTEVKPKFDQSFDDLNENYIPTAYKNDKLEKTFFGFELPGNIKKIALYTGLIAAGAIFMLLIMNNDRKNKIVVQQVTQQPEQIVTEPTPIVADIEENTIPLPESFEPQEYQSTQNPEISKEIQKPKVTVTKDIPVKKTEEKRVAENISVDKKLNTEQPVNEVKEVKKSATANISSQLSLKANDYNMGSFGGIKNLEMTLQNNSQYVLDKVTVSIKYLNPEGNTVNSDIIYFQSIEPGEVATIPVNKSKRGVKIDYKITKVESKELTSNNSKSAESNNYSKN